MINFPDDPQLHEIFQNWQWDGIKWIPAPQASTMPEPTGPGAFGRTENETWENVLPLTGGVMSGSLALQDIVGRFTITPRELTWVDALQRRRFQFDVDEYTLTARRFTDDGDPILTPLFTLDRSVGQFIIPSRLYLSNGISIDTAATQPISVDNWGGSGIGAVFKAWNGQITLYGSQVICEGLAAGIYFDSSGAAQIGRRNTGVTVDPVTDINRITFGGGLGYPHPESTHFADGDIAFWVGPPDVWALQGASVKTLHIRNVEQDVLVNKAPTHPLGVATKAWVESQITSLDFANNVPALRQRNAADTAWLNLPFINNNDVLQVSQSLELQGPSGQDITWRSSTTGRPLLRWMVHGDDGSGAHLTLQRFDEFGNLASPDPTIVQFQGSFGDTIIQNLRIAALNIASGVSQSIVVNNTGGVGITAHLTGWNGRVVIAGPQVVCESTLNIAPASLILDTYGAANFGAYIARRNTGATDPGIELNRISIGGGRGYPSPEEQWFADGDITFWVGPPDTAFTHGASVKTLHIRNVEQDVLVNKAPTHPLGVATKAWVESQITGTAGFDFANNVPALRQRNAANDAWLNLPFINADDRLQMSQGIDLNVNVTRTLNIYGHNLLYRHDGQGFDVIRTDTGVRIARQDCSFEGFRFFVDDNFSLGITGGNVSIPGRLAVNDLICTGLFPAVGVALNYPQSGGYGWSIDGAARFRMTFQSNTTPEIMHIDAIIGANSPSEGYYPFMQFNMDPDLDVVVFKDPVKPLGIATKHYVDEQIATGGVGGGITIGSVTEPSAPSPGDIWTSQDGDLFVRTAGGEWASIIIGVAD
jgi:hypothetical protein